MVVREACCCPEVLGEDVIEDGQGLVRAGLALQRLDESTVVVEREQAVLRLEDVGGVDPCALAVLSIHENGA